MKILKNMALIALLCGVQSISAMEDEVRARYNTRMIEQRNNLVMLMERLTNRANEGRDLGSRELRKILRNLYHINVTRETILRDITMLQNMKNTTDNVSQIQALDADIEWLGVLANIFREMNNELLELFAP